MKHYFVCIVLSVCGIVILPTVGILVELSQLCFSTHKSYADINECARYPSPCSQFANCSNTNGSYECSCQPTHKGDGVRCILNGESQPKSCSYMYV